MRAVAVLPWIWRPYMQECLAGCRLADVLTVDNATHNMGIMRSHNHGVDWMRERDADWLVIISAAVRFGPAGGLDFLDALKEHSEHRVISAEGTFGWHLIAFRRDLIEATGRWDENLSPYGYCDVDYSIRYHKVWPDVLACQVQVDVTDTTMGHSLKLAGVKVDNRRLLAYMTEKWGRSHGVPFGEYHDHPWNDVTNPIGFWPPPTTFDPVNGAVWDQPVPRPPQATVWNAK